jgi:gas vesicle protein
MSEKSSNSGFAFLSGLVIGAAVGALAGLLFAPAPGDETREKLTEKTKELSDDLSEKFDNLKETVNEVLEDVKKTGTEVLEDVKKATKKTAPEA